MLKLLNQMLCGIA